MSFDDIWSNAKLSNKAKSGNEPLRTFMFKRPNEGQYYDYNYVYNKAQKLRKLIEKQYPNKYRMTIAVLDKNVGTWKSGKNLPCSNPNIYVWSDADYDGDAEHNDETNGLQAIDFSIIVSRIP